MHLVAIGGSDAGISAALRARELDLSAGVTVVVADAYPNFSICGIPYYVSGEVTHWRNLAHRTYADLEATGMRLRLDTHATSIDVGGRRLAVREKDGSESVIEYDELVVGTGAVPVRPPIEGLDTLGVDDGVHLLHSMGDTFALTASIDGSNPRPPSSSALATSGWRWPRDSPFEALPSPKWRCSPRYCRPSIPNWARWYMPNSIATALTVHTRATVTRHQPERQRQRPASRRWPGTRPGGARLGRRPGAGRGRCSPRHRSARCGGGASRSPRRRDRRRHDGAPGSRTSGRPVTASSPTTASSASPTCRWAQPPTNKAESPARTRSAARPDSPAASAPRSSRCSTSSPPAPGSANMKRSRPASTQSPARPAPTITRRTIPGAQPINIRITGDAAHRPAARRAAHRPPRHRNRETGRHLRHRPVPHDDRRRHVRTRPVLHPSPRLAVGCRSDGHPRLGPRTPTTAQRSSTPRGDVDDDAGPPCCSSACTTPDGPSSPPGSPPREAGDSVTVLSAGTEPDDEVSEVMLASLAELGIDRSDQVPTQLTDDSSPRPTSSSPSNPDLRSYPTGPVSATRLGRCPTRPIGTSTASDRSGTTSTPKCGSF